MPLTVLGHVSLLAPHLGGKAYPMRSAIVAAVGSLVQKGFQNVGEGPDAQGAVTVMHMPSGMHSYSHALILYPSTQQLHQILDHQYLKDTALTVTKHGH